MADGATAGASQVADLLEALRSLGADAGALAQRAGVTAAMAAGSEARVPAHLLVELFDAAALALGDPHVGLHAGARVATRGPLFYLLLSTPRLSDGMQLWARFARVALSTQQLRMQASGGVVELVVDPGDPLLRRSAHAVDYLLGANLSTLRRAVPGFRLLAVKVAHAEMAPRGEAARTYDCPVTFGCAHSALLFPEAAVDGMPAAANAAVAEQIRRYTAALFDQLSASAAADRTAQTVRRLLLGGSTAPRRAVAACLRVSERTLQRQLALEGTRFTLVRDAVRAELARALLANPGLKIEAIALSLGFADSAAFCKAFARWCGASPSLHRAGLSRAAAAEAAAQPGTYTSSSLMPSGSAKKTA